MINTFSQEYYKLILGQGVIFLEAKDSNSFWLLNHRIYTEEFWVILENGKLM